ncbi:hypothetical protein [Streptomyces beihaiensis]|uniref:Uncharacterized protein n=1 Tax=Streptomyces beihaiensis TaxID=2984495 RepID=A0ABT3TQ53_9ACTN|nr:hypothetical protein [Streptomyces beihaiensis]MCX3059168.1 hypothetical protein [Streptomyces beihaiensis]
MAAPANLLLSALPKQADTTTTSADTTTVSCEPPLTSEPPFADYAPLTSEPPLTDETPLTSEPTPSGMAAW